MSAETTERRKKDKVAATIRWWEKLTILLLATIAMTLVSLVWIQVQMADELAQRNGVTHYLICQVITEMKLRDGGLCKQSDIEPPPEVPKKGEPKGAKL